MHEVIGQLHHLDEAMIDDGKPAVRAKHAQAVRHVVERGIELARQRRLAEARGQGFDEDLVQAEVDAFQTDKEKRQQHGKARFVEGKNTSVPSLMPSRIGTANVCFSIDWSAAETGIANSRNKKPAGTPLLLNLMECVNRIILIGA